MTNEQILTKDEEIHALMETTHIFARACLRVLGNDGFDETVNIISTQLVSDGHHKEAAFISGLLASFARDDGA